MVDSVESMVVLRGCLPGGKSGTAKSGMFAGMARGQPATRTFCGAGVAAVVRDSSEIVAHIRMVDNYGIGATVERESEYAQVA